MGEKKLKLQHAIDEAAAVMAFGDVAAIRAALVGCSLHIGIEIESLLSPIESAYRLLLRGNEKDYHNDIVQLAGKYRELAARKLKEKLVDLILASEEGAGK